MYNFGLLRKLWFGNYAFLPVMLTEGYLDPSKTSAIGLFCEQLTVFKSLTRFAKKLHRRCSTGFQTHL